MARNYLDLLARLGGPAAGPSQLPTPGVGVPGGAQAAWNWLQSQPPLGAQAVAGALTWPWQSPPYNDPWRATMEVLGAATRGLSARWPEHFPPDWVEVAERLDAEERSPELWERARALPWYAQPGMVQQYEWHNAPWDIRPRWPWER